jgi:hypothetical protein
MNEQVTPEQVDDVEAHGFKDIAIGIAAAGAVSTGGAAFAAMSGPSIPPVPIVEQARDDAQATAADATGAASTLAADAATFATHTTANARTIADNELRDASTFLTSTRDSIDETVARTVPSIDRTIDSTARTAVRTVNDTKATATSTVASVSDTATRTATSAEASALSVVSMVEDLANHWTVNVGVFGAKVGADGSITNPGGTITLTDSTGGVLATADIHDGQANLSFTTPAGGGTLTLHYPGDGLFGPTQQTLHLPAPAL